ncbi:MAG: B12-binding domain-containing radical SAM protein [Candidatus Thorarchaeota archaeon]
MDVPVPLFQCLGILSLAAVMKERGIPCEVMDLFQYSKSSEEEPEFVINSIAEKIVTSNPDVLGLSTMSNNLAIALQLCQTVKESLPNITTVLGGPGSTFCANEILDSFSQIDAVIRGEADYAFPDFIEELISGSAISSVPGVVIRDGPDIIDNGWPDPIMNLDSLPVPLYDLCEKSSETQKSSISVEVGRGCPFACTFCSTSAFFKRVFRVKSANRILKELTLINREFGNQLVLFNHDLLTFKRSFVDDLSESLVATNTRVRWSASARLDTIDEEMLKKMSDAGCEGIFLGIEVATDEMQQKINKRLNLSSFKETMEIILNLGYRVTTSFIVGIPEMDLADVQALWELGLYAKSLDKGQVTIQVHSLAPEQGSSLHEKWSSNLLYDDYGCVGNTNIPPAWVDMRRVIRKHPAVFSNHFYIKTETISREDILKHMFLSYLVDAAMVYSVQEAYDTLGNDLPSIFVEGIDRLPLPPPPHWPKLELIEMMQALRHLILGEIRNDSHAAKRYDSLAQWEIAARQVLDRKPEPITKVIDVHFNPLRLIEFQENKLGEVDLEEQQQFLAVLWDNETDEMKVTKITPSLASLINTGLVGKCT